MPDSVTFTLVETASSELMIKIRINLLSFVYHITNLVFNVIQPLRHVFISLLFYIYTETQHARNPWSAYAAVG